MKIFVQGLIPCMGATQVFLVFRLHAKINLHRKFLGRNVCRRFL